MTTTNEPDYGCYEANFSFPPKGECVGCKYYEKCKEMCMLEIAEEEELSEEEGMLWIDYV